MPQNSKKAKQIKRKGIYISSVLQEQVTEDMPPQKKLNAKNSYKRRDWKKEGDKEDQCCQPPSYVRSERN